jgi:hypothetical protein
VVITEEAVIEGVVEAVERKLEAPLTAPVGIQGAVTVIRVAEEAREEVREEASEEDIKTIEVMVIRGEVLLPAMDNTRRMRRRTYLLPTPTPTLPRRFSLLSKVRRSNRWTRTLSPKSCRSCPHLLECSPWPPSPIT